MEVSEKSEKNCREGGINCRRLVQQKSYYTGLISKSCHEMRNSLTLIASSLQLLETEHPGVRKSSLWPQIKQDIQDVLSMLHDLSSINHSGKLNRVRFPVVSFLSEIRTSFLPLMKERGVSFDLLADDSLDSVTVSADKRKLREAISNLLLNALDAAASSENTSMKDSASGIVRLSAHFDGTDLSIHVKDNGPGIPDEYLPTLFDPFVTHKPHGTGLGLGIARSIINSHSGSISVSTHAEKPETYTDFCLRLPASPAKSEGKTR